MGSDYQALPLTEVMFPAGIGAGGEPRTVTVQIFDDDVGEPDESFIVSLIPMSPDMDKGLSVPITIIDNERKYNNII